MVLWETQLSCGDPAHFRLKDGVNIDIHRYEDKIAGLLQESEQRFQVFGELETDITVFHLPFTVEASDI